MPTSSISLVGCCSPFPLLLVFILWALQDCLRSSRHRPLARFCFALLIILLPLWGAYLWFRHKAVTRLDQSAFVDPGRRQHSDDRELPS